MSHAVAIPWLIASLISALFLGCYDLSTKHAVRGNAVLPVLFFANCCSAAVWLALMLVHRTAPEALPSGLHVASLDLGQHAIVAAAGGTLR